MMYLFTLWYRNNTIIDHYFDLYLKQLQKIGSTIIPQNTLLNRNLLLLPDISTSLEWCHAQKIGEIQVKEFIRSEWDYFSSNQKNQMLSNSGRIIQGTDIHLTTIDANPDNKNHNHPEHIKNGVGIGWWNIHEDYWLDLYAEAFSLLRRASPDFAHELDRMIHKIIPLGVTKSMHNSASYSTCIGHLYMSYPVEIEMPELAVLEAIIHESNHNKLNLIMKSDPLILNTREEIYYSPYRPDARHIYGIYLWVHALVAVIHLFFHAHVSGIFTMNHSWLEKSMIYHMKNALSFRILRKYAKLTPLGQKILEEMEEVHKETIEKIRSIAFEDALLLRSSMRVKEHFQEVQSLHIGLRY